MKEGTTYVVKTNLDPAALNQVGLAIFAKWLDFAMGQAVLGGKRIVYPTGRYAAALQYRQVGEAAVAIIADEDVAPEAAILEKGHASIDLKTRLMMGRGYPMHRAQGGNRTPGGLRRVGGAGPPGLTPKIWADIRTTEGTGFASIGPNSPPGSWIIPPMAAYSPALTLSNIATAMARVAG